MLLVKKVETLGLVSTQMRVVRIQKEIQTIMTLTSKVTKTSC